MTICMEMDRVSLIIATLNLVGAWRCPTLDCVVYPLSLKLWKNQIEVSARSLEVKVGSNFSVTCDGSCVGSQADPHLRWYGPDKYWISHEGSHNRIHVEQSISRRYLKLHIQNARREDSGLYTCRGWLGTDIGWDTETIRINMIGGAPPIVPTIISSVVMTTRRSSTAAPSIVPKIVSSVVMTTRRPSTAAIHSVPKIVTAAATTTRQPATTIQRNMSTHALSTERTCLPPKFLCGSGECFDHQYVCDSFPDCGDGSDEANCESRVCTEDMIACTDGDGCVSREEICDGTRQCRDGSDENPDVCEHQKK